MTCTIIPPYVLEQLAGSADAAVARRARETLALDEQLRRERFGGRPVRGRARVSPPPPQRADDGPSRSIYDAKNTEQLPGDLVRSEGQRATADRAVTEAYDGLGATWQLWMHEYGRDSLDDNGLPLLATVHYGSAYDNAFWDGSQMVFGDGDGVIFMPFTRSLDVIGHELAHGVTEYTSGLNYRGQSGALNESISDVFGVLVKQRLLGQDAAEADWLIGADLLAAGVRGRALRSMAEPGTAYDDPRLGTDPQPAHMRDYVETSDDNGGVHINSGIPNRAFHLVATAIGGPAWRLAGQIWFETIMGDIKADCDFATFAALTITASEKVAHDDPAARAAVREAWSAVGVVPGAAKKKKSSKGTTRAPVPPATEVVIRRTGGIAGLTRENRLAIDQLPAVDAQRWQRLLSGDSLHELAADAPQSRADAFCYGIECAAPAVDVQIPEPALPEQTRKLFERALRAGQAND